MKFGRADGGAKSGSFTELESLEAPRDHGDEPADNDFLGGPALTRSPLGGTVSGASDFLRPFEIDSSFKTPRSFNFMVTIPYWLLYSLGIALVVFAWFRQTGTEQVEDLKPDHAPS